MAVVKYIAKRSLLVTVTIGEQITFTLPLKYAGRGASRAAQGATREAMLGARETYYYRGKKSWMLTFNHVDATMADRMRQFLDSIEDGQVFSFAPDGTDSTPSPEYRNVVINSASYSEDQVALLQERVQFSAITLVEVP